MSTKAQASAILAVGTTTATTKTSIDTLQVPQGVKRIIGAWCYAVGGAGTTTLENISGICELESPDVALQPLQMPIDAVVVLTSGTAALNPRIFPLNIPVGGGEKITGYLTLDLAQTIAHKARFGLVYETA